MTLSRIVAALGMFSVIMVNVSEVGDTVRVVGHFYRDLEIHTNISIRLYNDYSA